MREPNWAEAWIAHLILLVTKTGGAFRYRAGLANRPPRARRPTKERSRWQGHRIRKAKRMERYVG